MRKSGPWRLSQTVDSRRQCILKSAILPVAAHVGLFLIHDLRSNLPAFLALVAVAFVGLLVAERLLREIDTSIGLAMGLVAVCLRLLMVFVPPTLSDDVYRYVWDGRVVQSGFNPYQLPPDAPQLTHLRDELWDGLAHRHVPTVYPPLAQAMFTVVAWLPAPVYSLKALLALADVGTCILLFLLVRTWRLPQERVLWYAWNPLVTLEIAGMGHIDGLAISLVVLATLLLAGGGRRVGGAALTAGAAVLTKLVPLLALPTWARQSSRHWQFALLAGAVSLGGLLPLITTTGGMPPGLVRYAVSWEFNGPLFEPLWRVLDSVDFPATIHIGLDRLKEMTGRHDFWNRFYPLNYPQLWAKVFLALGLTVALLWAWRERDTSRSMQKIFGVVLMFSATVYSWYAIWVLPWAAMRRSPAWLMLTGLLFLSYLPQFTCVTLYPWIYGAIWVPFLVVLLGTRRWSMR